MPLCLIDTNAGPVLRRPYETVDDCRAYCESAIPLLRRRGYTCEWTRNGPWHVCTVRDSKGNEKHRMAFMEVDQ